MVLAQYYIHAMAKNYRIDAEMSCFSSSLADQGHQGNQKKVLRISAAKRDGKDSPLVETRKSLILSQDELPKVKLQNF